MRDRVPGKFTNRPRSAERMNSQYQDQSVSSQRRCGHGSRFIHVRVVSLKKSKTKLRQPITSRVLMSGMSIAVQGRAQHMRTGESIAYREPISCRRDQSVWGRSFHPLSSVRQNSVDVPCDLLRSRHAFRHRFRRIRRGEESQADPIRPYQDRLQSDRCPLAGSLRFLPRQRSLPRHTDPVCRLPCGR